MSEMTDNRSKIHVVLLSGGSGTRLWPLSNSARSKQFLKVLRDAEGNRVSMVQRTFAMISNVPANLDVTVATSETQAQSLAMQLPDGNYSLVVEPERRDTAPAIMLACAHLALKQHADIDDTVVVMPIDTYADQGYYDGIADLDGVVQSGVADLVLLGVEPTYPSSKYGYIVPGASHEAESVISVAAFVEKPVVDVAERLIESGALWNCGVFAFRLGYLAEITKSYSDVSGYETFLSRYSELPNNSFDYEVVEKARSIAAVSYAGAWKDLGTWNTLTEEMAETSSGWVIGVDDTCENTHVVNELNLPLVVLGLKNTAIIATHDGILVSNKAMSSYMKPYVEQAAANRPMYERRRWGEYRVLDAAVYGDTARQLTKELVVREGRQLSYQRHASRSEVWTIVSGEGEVVLEGSTQHVTQGDVVVIRSMQKHSVRALSELHIIEVQTGNMLEEEDIERFGNYWE